MNWNPTLFGEKRPRDRPRSRWGFPLAMVLSLLFVLYLLSPIPALILAETIEDSPLKIDDAVDVHGVVYSVWSNLCADSPPALRQFWDLQNQVLLRWQ